MLKCKEVTEKASAYLDEELSWWQRVEFRMHLLMCHHCRRFMNNFRIGIQMVKRLPRHQVSARQIEEIERRISKMRKLDDDA